MMRFLLATLTTHELKICKTSKKINLNLYFVSLNRTSLWKLVNNLFL